MSETLTARGWIRLRMPSAPLQSMAAVFENEDLLALILQKVELTPVDFVSASRVCKGWHELCVRDGALVLQAAKTAQWLTKRVLMGLLVLSSYEANQLPRATKLRRGGGFMYLYPVSAVDRAWDEIGGSDGWCLRLRKRSQHEQAMESVFGTDWREVLWPASKCPRLLGPGARVCAVY